MKIIRLALPGVVAVAVAVMTGGTSVAADLVYGSWTPAQEYQNRVLMPELFR